MTTTRVAPQAALAGATYRKSTRSTATGDCVEIAELPGGHCAVRDSKHPTGPVLSVTSTAWAAFTTALRAGDFD
jgi:Domain of unknown function (DUF397)